MIDKINNDLIIAMKNKESFKLSVLRMLKSALENEKIRLKKELDDNEVISAIKKQVKMRNDSLIEYEKYGKEDTVNNLKEEIKILSEYLPEEISDEKLNEIISSVFEELKPTSMKDMGMMMKNTTAKLDGYNYDSSKVSSIIKDKLMKL